MPVAELEQLHPIAARLAVLRRQEVDPQPVGVWHRAHRTAPPPLPSSRRPAACVLSRDECLHDRAPRLVGRARCRIRRASSPPAHRYRRSRARQRSRTSCRAAGGPRPSPCRPGARRGRRSAASPQAGGGRRCRAPRSPAPAPLAWNSAALSRCTASGIPDGQTASMPRRVSQGALSETTWARHSATESDEGASSVTW